MDYHDRDGLLEEATLKLITAYGFVIKALMGLPLSIEIPAAMGTAYRKEITEGLTRALDILSDVPMDDAHREHVRGLVIDWLTAADYLFQAEEEFEWWKVEFVVTQLTRVIARWEKILDLRSRE